MATGSDTKLYVALGVLAVLGGALYFQTERSKKVEAEHSYEGMNDNLPTLDLTEEKLGKATKLIIDKPATEKGEDKVPAEKIVLVKEGESWKLSEPVSYAANEKNVESLLKNLPKLEIKERIAKGQDSYASYDLTDDKALHVKVLAGDESLTELWFGKGGGRGQMVRVAGAEGVYVVDGYSSFVYQRDASAWRDKSITEVDPEKATKVVIENESGEFVFKKDGESWTGKFKKDKSPVGLAIDEFDPKKVDDLLRAYKTLNAVDFGDDLAMSEAGLEEPVAKLTISEGDRETTLLFGETSEGSSRWVKLESGDQIYSVSSWAAGWATAEAEKFQKKDENEEESGPPGGMPPGMAMPPGMGMPPGHP